jgi:hypothetical protein
MACLRGMQLSHVVVYKQRPVATVHIMLRPSIMRYCFTLALLGVALSVLITLTGLSKHPSFFDAYGKYYGQDFINYWGAPQLAATDISQLFDNVAYNLGLDALYGSHLPLHNWSYPLHLLLLLAPFASFTLPVAYGLWTVLGIAFYSAVVWHIAPMAHRRLAVFMAAIAPASLMCILFGQNGFFTAALFLAAWHLLGTRPKMAGIALGLLTVKPQLGVVWPLLLLQQKRWTTILVATLTAAMLLGLSLWKFGVDAWRGYLTQAAAYQWSLVREPLANRHYETMVPSFSNALQRLGLHVDAAYALQIAIAIAVILCLLRDFARAKTLDSRSTLLVATAAMLATPYLFNYDMTLITAALVCHLLTRPPVAVAERWLYALAYLTPALVYWFYFTIPLAPFILLALFITLLRQSPTRSP